jgi:hypothetical protein
LVAGQQGRKVGHQEGGAAIGLAVRALDVHYAHHAPGQARDGQAAVGLQDDLHPNAQQPRAEVVHLGAAEGLAPRQQHPAVARLLDEVQQVIQGHGPALGALGKGRVTPDAAQVAAGQAHQQGGQAGLQALSNETGVDFYDLQHG